jgi:hypothetical protein
METRLANPNHTEAGAPTNRRKRRNQDEGKLRFFLAKQGSNLKALELGEEVPTEGEALIRSLKSDQPFFAVSAWKAVAEQNGKGGPVIVKQPAPDKLD